MAPTIGEEQGGPSEEAKKVRERGKVMHDSSAPLLQQGYRCIIGRITDCGGGRKLARRTEPQVIGNVTKIAKERSVKAAIEAFLYGPLMGQMPADGGVVVCLRSAVTDCEGRLAEGGMAMGVQ